MCGSLERIEVRAMDLVAPNPAIAEEDRDNEVVRLLRNHRGEHGVTRRSYQPQRFNTRFSGFLFFFVCFFFYELSIRICQVHTRVRLSGEQRATLNGTYRDGTHHRRVICCRTLAAKRELRKDN